MLSRRFCPAARLRVERRAEGDAPGRPRIVGHAAVFNQWTTLYEGRYWTWREMIRPGAFANALKEEQDVRALFNHDSNFVLGRTVAGTLALKEDETGLFSETDPPDSQTIRDLVIAPIERGDVSGMSFGFLPRKGETTTVTEKDDGSTVIETGGMRTTIRYEGERRIEEDEILDADLFDVSPVTYPAYAGTDVGMRAALFGLDQERIREMDRPHKRPAPVRDQYREKLTAWGVALAPPK